MAQDSKRKRQLRRVKRERTQLRQAIGYADNQLQQMARALIQTQAELKALKSPAYTIETVVDPDNYFPPDVDMNDHEAVLAAGITPVCARVVDPAAITQEMNDACCIDDSPAS